MVDFLLIGPRAGIIYDNIFPLIKDRRVMFGSLRKDISFGDEGISCRWFQSIRSFYVDPLLLKEYKEEEYSKYDHFDAINIDKVSDIPYDYEGVMGVPVSFIDKLDYRQFELIGFCNKGSRVLDKFRLIIDGEFKYVRLLIRKRK